MNSLSAFLRSRLFTALIIGFGLLALLVSVYGLGVLTGYRKASVAYGGGGDFYRVFGTTTDRSDGSGPIPGVPPDLSGGFGNDHGASGTIIAVSSSTITIEDMSHTEIEAAVSPTTMVRDGRDSLTLSSLQIGQAAVVFGESNQGMLDAALIRIIPPQGTQ